jgi:hypothetical protein
LAAAAVGAVVSSDLSGRFGGQSQRRRSRAQQGRPHRRRGGCGRHQARAGDLGANIGGREVLGRGVRRAGQPRHQRCADRVLRRAHRLPRSDRGDLAELHDPNLCGASDPGRDAVRELEGPQSRRGGAETDLPSRRRRRGADRAGGVSGLRVGPQEPPHRRCVRQRVGTFHPVPGVPSDAAPGDLYHG